MFTRTITQKHPADCPGNADPCRAGTIGTVCPITGRNQERVIRIGQFGNLEVFVADPYSIALSKLDRGLDTDFDDLLFLIQSNYVNMDEFERILSSALPHARQFDFSADILEHLQELKNRLK